MPNKYTPEQLAFVEESYMKMTLKQVTVAFDQRWPALNIREAQIRAMIRNHKFKSGRTGYFPSGNKSWNHGTTGLTGRNKTSYKKGSIPVNLKPLGHERVCRDGYVMIKVKQKCPHTGRATRYVLKHKHVWEQVNGPLPQGQALLFIDSDRSNTDVENLLQITRGELAVINKKYNWNDLPVDRELRLAVVATVRLQIEMGKHKK